MKQYRSLTHNDNYEKYLTILFHIGVCTWRDFRSFMFAEKSSIYLESVSLVFIRKLNYYSIVSMKIKWLDKIKNRSKHFINSSVIFSINCLCCYSLLWRFIKPVILIDYERFIKLPKSIRGGHNGSCIIRQVYTSLIFIEESSSLIKAIQNSINSL